MGITRDQIIALSGVFQSAYLVHEVATKGYIEDESSANISIFSLFERSPNSAEAVFGNDLNALRVGIRSLTNATGKHFFEKFQSDVMRYVISLLQVSAELQKKPKLLEYIGEQLSVLHDLYAPIQDSCMSEEHAILFEKLAGIYTKTLSQFKFRIQIFGQAEYLSSELNANKIRAWLLAGTRSAILWQQVGGSRWHFVFCQNKIQSVAADLQRDLIA